MYVSSSVSSLTSLYVQWPWSLPITNCHPLSYALQPSTTILLLIICSVRLPKIDHQPISSVNEYYHIITNNIIYQLLSKYERTAHDWRENSRLHCSLLSCVPSSTSHRIWPNILQIAFKWFWIQHNYHISNLKALRTSKPYLQTDLFNSISSYLDSLKPQPISVVSYLIFIIVIYLINLFQNKCNLNIFAQTSDLIFFFHCVHAHSYLHFPNSQKVRFKIRFYV